MEKSDVFNVKQLKTNHIINKRDSKTFKHTNSIFIDNETPQKWNKILISPLKNSIESPTLLVSSQFVRGASRELRIKDQKSNIFLDPNYEMRQHIEKGVENDRDGIDAIYYTKLEIKPYDYNWWKSERSPRQESQTQSIPTHLINHKNPNLLKSVKSVPVDAMKKGQKNFSEIFDCGLGKYYANHIKQNNKQLRMIPTNLGWINYDTLIQGKEYPIQQNNIEVQQVIQKGKQIAPKEEIDKIDSLKQQSKAASVREQNQNNWKYHQLFIRGIPKKFNVDKLREVGLMNDCTVCLFKNDFNQDNKLVLHSMVIKQKPNQSNFKEIEKFLVSQGGKIVKDQKISENEFIAMQRTNNEIKTPVDNEGYRQRMEKVNASRQGQTRAQSANVYRKK